MTEIMLKPTAT